MKRKADSLINTISEIHAVWQISLQIRKWRTISNVKLRIIDNPVLIAFLSCYVLIIEVYYIVIYWWGLVLVNHKYRLNRCLA